MIDKLRPRVTPRGAKPNSRPHRTSTACVPGAVSSIMKATILVTGVTASNVALGSSGTPLGGRPAEMLMDFA
ncbi:MAG: hypothetical protein JWO70_3504 [Betaproteobacteria bacterium]|jgi:hypothetical protein|nr:hypothetical protein [Betaproteobacteria bacterium]